MIIHDEVLEKLTEEDWSNIALEALAYWPKANDRLKGSLNRALQSAGIKISGFREPISAKPTSLLNKIILENLDDPEIKEILSIIWLDSKDYLRGDVLEFVNKINIEGELDGKEVLRQARLYLKQQAKPKVGEVALCLSLLASKRVAVEPIEEPGKNQVDETKGSEGKLKKALAKEKAKNKLLEDRIQSLKERLADFEEEKKQLTDQISMLNEQIKSLAADTDKGVADKVKHYMRSLLMEYEDKKEERVFQNVIESFDSVEELARSAIQTQAEKNKRSGTIVEIRERHDGLLKLLAELRLLKDQSVFVVPQVDKAIDAIHAEIKSIMSDALVKKILQGEEDLKLLVDMGKISDLKVTKSSLPEIEAMSETVILLKDRALISDEDSKLVEQALQDKLSKIIKAQGIHPVADAKAVNFDDGVYSGAFKDKILVIDGNNILLTTYLSDTMAKVPAFAAKRRDFNNKVLKLAMYFSKILIVYDGDQSNKYPLGDNMTLVYTDKVNAGIEADDEIVRVLSKLDADMAVVATNDGNLMERCGDKACTFLLAEDCYEFFCG